MPKEDTQFKKGQSGNPNGRPKGFSIVSHLKEKLQEIEEGQKESYATRITKKYIDKALHDGDVTILKDLIDRVDGKAIQKVVSDVNLTSNISEDDAKKILESIN